MAQQAVPDDLCSSINHMSPERHACGMRAFLPALPGEFRVEGVRV